MAEIDDHIATYLQAIEIEGKSVKTIASYANTLAISALLAAASDSRRAQRSTASRTFTPSSRNCEPEAPQLPTSTVAIGR